MVKKGACKGSFAGVGEGGKRQNPLLPFFNRHIEFMERIVNYSILFMQTP